MVIIAPSTGTITLTLPFPPKALSPNARLHRLAKAPITRDYRFEVKVTALQGLRDRYGENVRLPLRMAMVCTYIFKSNRRRDLDNLLAGSKALVDGLVDAGILIDDSTRYLASVTVASRVDTTIAKPYVEVALHAAGEDA